MIYLIQADGVGHVKIGFTAEDANVRLEQLQTGSPVALRLLGVLPGDMATEKDLHRRFGSHRVNGEWFRGVPEILALAGEPDGRVCGETAVVEKSVQIKVLTVGRKQVTKSLVLQLPDGILVSWDTVARAAEQFVKSGRPHEELNYDWQKFIHGADYWGWVSTTPATKNADQSASLLFVRHGRLCKQEESGGNLPSWIPKQCQSEAAKEIISEVWWNFQSAFDNEKQLFIGV